MIHETMTGGEGGLPVWVGAVPGILFWLFWLIAIVHWWRKPAFYPVFPSERATRVFWGVLFVLVSPALTFLYYIFGVFMPSKRRPAWWRSALVLVPVFLVVLSVFWGVLPRTSELVISERDPKSGEINTPTSTGLSANAGVEQSTVNSTTSMGTTSSGNDNLVILSSVWIQEADDHPLVHETARRLHRRLAERASIERIGWGPPGSVPPVGERAFDFYITISLPKVDGIGLVGYRTLKGTMQAGMETTLYRGNHSVVDGFTPPRVMSNGHGAFDFTFEYYGLETPQSRYARTGAKLGDDLYARLQKTFDDLKEKHGPPVKLPNYLYGPMRPTAEPPFPDGAEVSLVGSSFGLLNHNHSIWRIDTGAKTDAYLEELHKDLVSAGWRGELEKRDGVVHYFRMVSGEDVFWVVREERITRLSTVREPDTADDSLVFYAHYVDRFDKKTYRGALERLLESQPEEPVMLAFSGAFKRMDLADAYFDQLEKRAFGSIDAAVTMARYYDKGEDAAEAKRLARRAEVLSWFGRGGKYRSEMESLREELGLEELDRSEMDLDILRDLDAVFLEEEAFPVSREVAPGQPVLLYWGADQDMWGVSARPWTSNRTWRFIWAEVGRGHTWSTSDIEVPAEGAILREWRADVSNGEAKMSLRITLERVDGGRLRYTFERQP